MHDERHRIRFAEGYGAELTGRRDFLYDLKYGGRVFLIRENFIYNYNTLFCREEEPLFNRFLLYRYRQALLFGGETLLPCGQIENNATYDKPESDKCHDTTQPEFPEGRIESRHFRRIFYICRDEIDGACSCHMQWFTFGG